eukprot:jgi/Phyca11/103854/e_gw1.8.897.1
MYLTHSSLQRAVQIHRQHSRGSSRERVSWRNTEDPIPVKLNSGSRRDNGDWSQLHQWVCSSFVQLVFSFRKVNIKL